MRSLFEAEIHEQPAALLRLLQEGRAEASVIAAAVRAFAPRFVMVAARGSSDNAARYAQYLFGVRNRLAVGLAAPSLFTQYDAAPSLEGALVLGISQSGQSPDIVEVLHRARSQGALTVAITNDPVAPLAEAAEHRLPLRAGKERAVAATKTYTTQLLALAMLSAAMEGSAAVWEEIEALPEQVGETIELNQRLDDSAARLAERRSHGRGGPRVQPLDRLRDRPQDQGDELRHGRSLLFGGFPARADRHARREPAPPRGGARAEGGGRHVGATEPRPSGRRSPRSP